MNYEIGSRVGDYEVMDILGAGGMGRVYKVRNVISDRVEAMKVLLPNLEGDAELADRFMREIKVQASMDHPNIAALHTAQRFENQLLMLMEYVEGTTLEHLLKQGPIPIGKAIDYMAQVLSALSYAHTRGVIHRDLKPANMILTPQGQIKLMDFGIATLAADRRLTQTGRTVGSLYYMSPEQVKGALDLDPRSDLYSLGVSLYEILTGSRPFQGDSDYSIMVAHLESTPVPLLQLDPSLPADLNEIVLQSIERDPAKRFQSADAFRNALLSVQGAIEPAHPVATAPAPAPPVAAPAPVAAQPSSSHRGLYIALGSLLTIAVLVVAAIQVPKYLGTRAESPAEPAATSPPVQTSSPPEAVSTPEQAAPAVQPETASPPPVAQPAAPRVPERRAEPNVPASRPAGQTAQPAQAPPAQAAPPQPAAQPPARQPAPPPADTAQLEEVRDQLMLLGTRAATIKGSLDRMRREQAAMGLGLRPDIAASAQRMEYFLDETEAALKRGDAAAAKKNLASAEREVSRVESFFGR